MDALCIFSISDASLHLLLYVEFALQKEKRCLQNFLVPQFKLCYDICQYMRKLIHVMSTFSFVVIVCGLMLLWVHYIMMLGPEQNS